jgi:hypothetical protein
MAVSTSNWLETLNSDGYGDLEAGTMLALST